MLWILVAIAGYLLGALALVTDKFLISSRRLPYPAGYAFLTSLFSLPVVALACFEPATLDWMVRALSLVSGVFFVYGLFFLYSSLEVHPVSVVAPSVSAVSAAVTLLPALVWAAVTGTGSHDLLLGMLAFALFVAGGFLVAFDLPIREDVSLRWKSIVLAGALFGLSYLVLKYGYALSGLPFIGSVVWSRLGFFLGGCSFLVFPSFRRQIAATTQRLLEPSAVRRNSVTGAVFLSNKVLGGAAVLLVNWAVFLGPVSLVQSMDSLRFAFVFLVARFLSRPFPEIFGEKLLFWDWAQKLAAIVILAVALWVASQVSLGGLPALS